MRLEPRDVRAADFPQCPHTLRVSSSSHGAAERPPPVERRRRCRRRLGLCIASDEPSCAHFRDCTANTESSGNLSHVRVLWSGTLSATFVATRFPRGRPQAFASTPRSYFKRLAAMLPHAFTPPLARDLSRLAHAMAPSPVLLPFPSFLIIFSSLPCRASVRDARIKLSCTRMRKEHGRPCLHAQDGFFSFCLPTSLLVENNATSGRRPNNPFLFFLSRFDVFHLLLMQVHLSLLSMPIFSLPSPVSREIAVSSLALSPTFFYPALFIYVCLLLRPFCVSSCVLVFSVPSLSIHPAARAPNPALSMLFSGPSPRLCRCVKATPFRADQSARCKE